MEGDVDDACNLHRTPEFLFHYGWRGTQRFSFYNGAVSSFLIHYGWRGTRGARRAGGEFRWFLIHNGWRGTIEISNQDWRNFVFLIHYGWRGTHQLSAVRRRCGVVSNPLRLEGNKGRAATRLELIPFLIHYGWRGTSAKRPGGFAIPPCF